MLRVRSLTWLLLAAWTGTVTVAACGSSGDDGTTTDTGTCTPSAETCNNRDDNCNGQVDENVTESCTEGGQSGTRTCTAGQWGACETSCTPSQETCNGKDDDCDSAVDEDADGNALTRDCTTTSNQQGKQTCTQGAWGACESSCTPVVESCNGKDDDCDGIMDEGDDGQPLKRDCSNDCGPGTEVCAGGQFTSCTAPQPKTEACNGVDDDCDGEIDDGFECAKGEQGACGTDVGECEFGTRTCGATCQWGNCIGGVNPGTEVCEGSKDEDCDGTVDNACTCTDGQEKDCCGGTQITCTGGTWPSCPAPPAETCNSKDDDCNGLVDDKLPVTPYQLEEDISGTNDCAHAKQISAAVLEGEAAVTQQGYLYKPDLSLDSDFFAFQAKEDSDLDCIFNPLWYECYDVTVKLTPPAGTNYQFCVYDIGYDPATATCSSPEQKVCSTQGSNTVTVHYQGDCGFDDTRYFYVEVKPGSGDADSCKAYSISIESADNVPQEQACTF